MFRFPLIFGLGLASMLACTSVHATGMVTCESGPRDTWQAPEQLQQQLEDAGWTVRRIKEDGGCYEVYALDGEGKRVEAYFHPQTLEPVLPKDED